MVEAAEDLEGSGQRLRGAAYSIRRGIRVEIRTAPTHDEPHAARRRRTPIAVGVRSGGLELQRVSRAEDVLVEVELQGQLALADVRVLEAGVAGGVDWESTRLKYRS